MTYRLLYITPYFPPATKVGALRPLKFVRHLAAHGFETVVLADLKRGDDVDPALFDAVPDGVDVRFTYGPGAASAFERAMSGARGGADAHETSDRAPKAPRRSSFEPPAWLKWSPEYVPLGEHSIEIPAALRAARRILETEPIDVILVNADPYAAMIVGDRVGHAAGVPVVHDLRDPWSVCDLRRPNRPAPQRAIVDKLERGIVTRSARVILNTETTLEAYRRHYADVDPERFTCIRNHGDAELISDGEWPREDADRPFTMLFLGNFRRFLHGNALLDGLAALRAAGHTADDVRFAVTGRVTDETRIHARSIGVEDMLEERPFVPYTRIGPAMDAADLLVANIPSRMRIPAKLYDYAMSRRPILALGDDGHDELRGIVERLPGARFARSDDAHAVAEAMGAAIDEGRCVNVDRSGAGLDSATATAKLAAVLRDAIETR